MSEQPEGFIKKQTQTDNLADDIGTALMDDTVVIMDATDVGMGGIFNINPTLAGSVTVVKPKGK